MYAAEHGETHESPALDRAIADLSLQRGLKTIFVVTDGISSEGALLTERRLTLSVAESCTGGLVAALVTDQPGSSAYFLGGVVAYANDVKRDELGVPAALLTRYGAVSKEVALAMAEGVRSRFSTALAASITGIAGPDAEGSKPVGLTYIAIATEHGSSCNEYMFTGDRWSNRRQAADEALRLLVKAARANASKLAS